MVEQELQQFKEVYLRGGPNYDIHRYQYAFTSEQAGTMEPFAIIYAHDEDDVVRAVNLARDNKIALAVRTGGHQYSGASSTNGPNLQLDMSKGFMDFEKDEKEPDLIVVGVSHALSDLDKLLGDRGLFVPHGQCSHVHVGGHAQSGGYGQLIRSFGLFADYIMRFQIVLADGQVRWVHRNVDADADLFFAVLGGSPGNFGVLLRIALKPLQDADYPKSRGLKLLVPYNVGILQELLNIMAEDVADVDFPRDYDLCVTVMSNNIIPRYLGICSDELDAEMRKEHPNLYGEAPMNVIPNSILVYAQWANVGGKEQEYDPSWFDRIKKACGDPNCVLERVFNKVKDVLAQDVLEVPMLKKEENPMSVLSAHWVFPDVREYDLPYNKRAYVTSATHELRDAGWAAWATGRIDEILSCDRLGDPKKGLHLACQFQHHGGQKSQYTLASNGKTAFSWRESTVTMVLDCFYEERSLEASLAWVGQNDREALDTFSKVDMRFLWGSYGDHNMGRVWPYYFDPPTYERLVQIKHKWDPQGVFTPNVFCVGADPTQDPQLLALDAQVQPNVHDAHFVSRLRQARQDKSDGFWKKLAK
jgi:hypothetical protein